MYRGYSPFLWIEIVSGLLLMGWILSEWLRWRHLKRFGDPRVLGLSLPWAPRIAALLMLISGSAAAVAILGLPATSSIETLARSFEIQILLDMQSLESADNRFWDALEDAVPAIVEQASASRFGVLATAWPPEVLVYPTADAKGLQIIVSRLRFEEQRGSRSGLAEVLAKYAIRRREQQGNSYLVVITTLSAEEIEHLPVTESGGKSRTLYARLSGGGEPTQYGCRAATGRWIWALQPKEIYHLMSAETLDRVTSKSPSAIQWLALLALGFLCGEYICNLAARSSAGRWPIA